MASSDSLSTMTELHSTIENSNDLDVEEEYGGEEQLRKEMFIWSHEHNVFFLQLLLKDEPYLKKHGTKQRGRAWRAVVEKLNTNEEPPFHVSERSVRDKFVQLMKMFADGKRTSGIRGPMEEELLKMYGEISRRVKEEKLVITVPYLKDENGKRIKMIPKSKRKTVNFRRKRLLQTRPTQSSEQNGVNTAYTDESRETTTGRPTVRCDDAEPNSVVGVNTVMPLASSYDTDNPPVTVISESNNVIFDLTGLTNQTIETTVHGTAPTLVSSTPLNSTPPIIRRSESTATASASTPIYPSTRQFQPHNDTINQAEPPRKQPNLGQLPTIFNVQSSYGVSTREKELEDQIKLLQSQREYDEKQQKFFATLQQQQQQFMLQMQQQHLQTVTLMTEILKAVLNK